MNNLESPAKAPSAKSIAKGLSSLKITSRKLILAVIAVTLILGILVAAWVFGNIRAKEKAALELDALRAEIQELRDNPIVVNPVAPEISLGILENQISEISELATAEYLFTDAARFSDSKALGDWKIPFTEKSFLMKWDGSIKAGIDISLLQMDIDTETCTISILLPEAEILSYEVFTDSIEVLDEKNNIFNSISVDDKVKFDSETESEMRSRAVSSGLLDRAGENAKIIILNLLYELPEVKQFYTVEFVN